MVKKLLTSLAIVSTVFLICMGTRVFAEDMPEAANTTINGKTIGWMYTIVDDKITDLSCDNPKDLIGNVEIPSQIYNKDVVSIEAGCFKYATEMTGVIIPTTIREIKDNTFEGCSKLVSVNFQLGVQKLGKEAFKNCTMLTSISIPTTINQDCGQNPFIGCTNLHGVMFQDHCVRVPANICQNMTGLTSVKIPEGVKEIGTNAFSGCPGLTEVTLPQTTETIKAYAFYDCANLKKITIPKSVTSISSGVFENHNSDLTVYCYKNSAADSYAKASNIKISYLGTDTSVSTGNDDKNTIPANTNEVANDVTNNVVDNSIDNNTMDNNVLVVGGLNSVNDTTKGTDPTIAKGSLPQTGENIVLMIGIVAITAISIRLYKKNASYNDIK